jgi:hypothetical protein
MKFADMLTPHEKVALLRMLEKVPTTTPCNACQNYRAGYCGLDEGAGKIPLDIQATGCNEWKFAPDSVPF